MPLHLPFHLGERLGERLGILALLLVLLAVLTGVSLTQAGLLDDGAQALEDITLPGLRQAQDLRRAVDEARGLEALLVLATDPRQRGALVTQLQRQRRLVDGQWAQHARRPMAEAERQLHAALGRQLASYWASQDKVLALLAADATASASEPVAAPAVPAASAASAAPAAPALQTEPAAQARLLLAGESQTAWRALGAALDAWQQHHAQRADALARQSRAQADGLRLVAGAVLAGVLLFSLASLLALLRHRQRGTAAGVPPAASGLPETLDRIVIHSRLVALNAAVQAARMGPPTPAERAERAHLAAEAEALARRCLAAQKGLRQQPPPTRNSVLPSSTLPPADSQPATSGPGEGGSGPGERPGDNPRRG